MTTRLLFLVTALWLGMFNLSGSEATAGQGGPAIRWQPVVEIATGAGQRGPWRQNESRYDFVDDPAVALGPDGVAAVAWVDQSRKAVLFQRVAADGTALLPQAIDVSRRPDTFSWIPKIALAPDDPRQVYVLWQEIVFSGGSHGGEMLLARSRDGGRSFESPVNLSNSAAGDGKGRLTPQQWDNGSYDLIAGPGGQVHLAWTEYEGPLWYSRSVDGGASFSAPRQLGGRAGPARAPDLALGPQGSVYLVWSQGGAPDADLWLAVSRDGGGEFQAPRALTQGPALSDAPRLAVDRSGVLHLAYGEQGPVAGSQPQVVYTRSSGGGIDFDPPRVVSVPFPEGRSGAGFPNLGLDARGNVLLVWELLTARGPRGLGYALSRDGGTRFSPAAVVPGSVGPPGAFNGSSQGLLTQKLAMNAAGAVRVANSSLDIGVGSRVWLIPAQVPD